MGYGKRGVINISQYEDLWDVSRIYQTFCRCLGRRSTIYQRRGKIEVTSRREDKRRRDKTPNERDDNLVMSMHGTSRCHDDFPKLCSRVVRLQAGMFLPIGL